MNNNKTSLKYIVYAILAVLFTWIIHEFAHWATSELLGYKSIMRINSVSSVDGKISSDLHKIIIAASGPILTILQALTFFILLKTKNWNKYFYPFLFTTFYMRFLAGLMNFINLNDEGKIGVILGIGTFTLPILVSILLFLMVYTISKKHKLSWKFQLSTTLIVMIVSSILILSDQFFRIRIL